MPGSEVHTVEDGLKLSHAASPDVVGVVVDGRRGVRGVGGRVVGSGSVNAVAYLHITHGVRSVQTRLWPVMQVCFYPVMQGIFCQFVSCNKGVLLPVCVL